MKLSLIIFAVFALVAYAAATVLQTPRSVPSQDDPFMARILGGEVTEPHIRHKRFTCDLLSVSVKGVSGFNHAACAAKCFSQRHWGGHCVNGDCVCVSKKW